MDQLPDKLDIDPLATLGDWLQEARDDGVLANPDAMTLATAGASDAPTARIVLCKAVVPDPGFLVFYTNYESVKGHQLASNARAACVFHWDHLNRQVRVEGRVVRSPASESDDYFGSREKESQIGAWSSAQSQPIESRDALMAKHIGTTRKLAALQQESGRSAIPRPPFWGGYRIWAEAVELWVRGAARLHDRGRWERVLEPNGEGFSPGPWRAERLQP